MAGNRQQVDAERPHVEADFARGQRGVGVNQRTASASHGGNFVDRLQYPGLVVRMGWRVAMNQNTAARRSVSVMRIATTTPEPNVSAAITHMAAGRPNASAVTPASTAPTA